jgi:hypothetical protein
VVSFSGQCSDLGGVKKREAEAGVESEGIYHAAQLKNIKIFS